MVLDVRARRSHIVAELPEDGAIRALQWSPDGSALAYVLEQGGQQTAYTVRRGGDQPPVAMLEAPAGLPLDVAWLADGRPVVVSMGVGPVGGLEAHRLAYDPATDERVLLPPDTPLVQPHAPWRSPDGRHQLYSLASADMVGYTSGCRTGALGLAGEEWVYLALLGGGYERQQAFKLRDVVLDLALWLPDGRVLMRGVADEGCAPGASGIYVARLGEEPRQLIQTGPFVTRDDDGGCGRRVRPQPGPHVDRVGQERRGGAEASIHLTPVDGGPSALLFAAPPRRTMPLRLRGHHRHPRLRLAALTRPAARSRRGGFANLPYMTYLSSLSNLIGEGAGVRSASNKTARPGGRAASMSARGG